MAALVVSDVPASAPLARVVAGLLAAVDRPASPGWVIHRVAPGRDALLVVAAFMAERGFPVALPACLSAGLRASVVLAEAFGDWSFSGAFS